MVAPHTICIRVQPSLRETQMCWCSRKVMRVSSLCWAANSFSFHVLMLVVMPLQSCSAKEFCWLQGQFTSPCWCLFTSHCPPASPFPPLLPFPVWCTLTRLASPLAALLLGQSCHILAHLSLPLQVFSSVKGPPPGPHTFTITLRVTVTLDTFQVSPDCITGAQQRKSAAANK